MKTHYNILIANDNAEYMKLIEHYLTKVLCADGITTVNFTETTSKSDTWGLLRSLCNERDLSKNSIDIDLIVLDNYMPLYNELHSRLEPCAKFLVKLIRNYRITAPILVCSSEPYTDEFGTYSIEIDQTKDLVNDFDVAITYLLKES